MLSYQKSNISIDQPKALNRFQVSWLLHFINKSSISGSIRIKMKLPCVALILVVATAQPSVGQSHGRFLVSIVHFIFPDITTTTPRCAGTLITNDAVLTTANCVIVQEPTRLAIEVRRTNEEFETISKYLWLKFQLIVKFLILGNFRNIAGGKNFHPSKLHTGKHKSIKHCSCQTFRQRHRWRFSTKTNWWIWDEQQLPCFWLGSQYWKSATWCSSHHWPPDLWFEFNWSILFITKLSG